MKVTKTTCKSIIAYILILCLVSALTLSCGKKDTQNSSVTETPVSGSKTPGSKAAESSSSGDKVEAAVNLYPDAPKISMEYAYTQDEEILKRSLLSLGNKERIQNVLNKAASGEEITFAFIGGSITYGYKVNKDECFATLITERLSEVFGTKVTCINAGISGTPSVLGNLRVERDVLCHDPDLVLVEFAVNDGGEDAYKNSYESLITKILQYKTNPAVMLLFTITRDGHTCESWMSEIGSYYELPMVSVPQSIWQEIQEGRLTYDDYSNDETHPNKQGHIWITELLYYCLEQIYDSGFETIHYALPKKAHYKNYYKDMMLHTNRDLEITSLGSWEAAKTMESFPDGFAYVPGSGNKPLTFKANCRAMIIIYHEMPTSSENTWGNAKIRIDGDLVQTVFSCSRSGWNNPTYCVVYENPVSEDHEFTISLDEESADKHFEILGIAYM